MDVSSILANSTDPTSAIQNQNKTTSSFESYFLNASNTDTGKVATDATTKSSSQTTSGESGLQEFMQYAKETPAQRMFDSWLKGQGVTEQQFNAMTPAEKQKLVDQFEAQTKTKMKSEMTAPVS